jgi:hypothetical protein
MPKLKTKRRAKMSDKSYKKSSGGVIANNPRQGVRAEYIAQYFFSEFCTAERVLRENDFGIDLYCSLMDISGAMGFTSTLFGVQIKSGDAAFKYYGDYVSQWLKMINVPLLMCRVNRSTLSIEIFSTWTINCLLSGEGSFNEISFVESYPSAKGDESLKMPEVIGDIATVWMGPPIIKCTLVELINNSVSKEKIKQILEEWISFESQNYARRHLDIAVYFGYTKWTTNESLKSSQRTWYRPHIFNIEYSKIAIHRVLEACTLFALNQGKDHQFVKGLAELLTKNSIVELSEMDSWQKGIIGINEA